MKKTILIGFLALTLIAAAACTNVEPVPSPSPVVTTAPVTTTNPTTAPATNPASPTPGNTASDGDVSGQNGAGTDGMIEGFEEGKTIDEADLPQRIADAIKEAYDQVKIKTITFANYMDEQVYHVILSEPAGEDKTEQFYVRADGTIVPYTAQENN